MPRLTAVPLETSSKDTAQVCVIAVSVEVSSKDTAHVLCATDDSDVSLEPSSKDTHTYPEV